MTDELDNWYNDWNVEPMPSRQKEKLQALIAKECNKARIDELEHIVSGSEYSADDFDWYELKRSEYSGTNYYSEVKHLNKAERIAQLQTKEEV